MVAYSTETPRFTTLGLLAGCIIVYQSALGCGIFTGNILAQDNRNGTVPIKPVFLVNILNMINIINKKYELALSYLV